MATAQDIGVITMILPNPRLLKSNSNMEDAGIEIISRLAWYDPGSFEFYRLVNPTLQAMFKLLVSEDGGGYVRSPRTAARAVIETMALEHPKQVFSPVLEFASSSSQNTDPKYREAAVSALGDIAEGCSQQMRGKLEPLLGIILGAHRDAEQTVRAAAVSVLGDIAKGCSQLMKDKLEPLLGIVLGAHRDAEQTVRKYASCALHMFAKHLQPEIVSRHQSVLPCILNALDEDITFIEEHSYRSLEALCGNMTREEILPFLDSIVNKLLQKLQRRSCHQLYHMICINAMRSVAAAAGQDFVPYAGRVLESMNPHLGLTDTEYDYLGTRHFVFVIELAKTVGRAGVEPMLAPYIEAALSATVIWKDTYDFLCNAAETLGDGFAKYLPSVVPRAISSCNLDEDLAPATFSSKYRNYQRPVVLGEKAAATRALGLFAVHTKSAFAPYLEESMSVMRNHSAHYDEAIRLQGVIGLKNILTAAAAVSESHSDGAAKAKEVLGTVMDRYIKAMDGDGDKRVVAQVCASMVGILEDLGYAAVEPYVPQITDSASRLLRGQSACQQADDGERDETLMAAVSNLLPALAKGGNNFSEEQSL